MGKNEGKNEIKTQVIYLYVCYRPGLEDCSSRPGIVSRSLSRGGFLFGGLKNLEVDQPLMSPRLWSIRMTLELKNTDRFFKRASSKLPKSKLLTQKTKI